MIRGVQSDDHHGVKHHQVSMFPIIFSNSILFDIPTGKLHMAVSPPRSSVFSNSRGNNYFGTRLYCQHCERQ